MNHYRGRQIISELSIRECRVDEAEALLMFLREAEATPGVTDTIEDLRRVIQDSRPWVLVAEVDGRLVGSVIGTFDGWRGNMYRLAVHPEFRRQGVARKLVAEIEQRLRDVGAKRITALVEKDHPWAEAFWEAHGYELDSNIARYVRNL